jgi:lipid A 3-O-deacylase
MLPLKLIALMTMTCALMACATDVAWAQRVTIVGENDVIYHHYDAARGFKTTNDSDYTQGLRASIAYENFTAAPLAGQAFGFFSNGLITSGAPAGPARQQIEFILGQSIFTPDQISRPFRVVGERPFGGWLYTGVAVAQETAGVQLDSFEILAGVVGPAALGEATQRAFHQATNAPLPIVNGWQLNNEPGILLAWDRRWKFGTNGTGLGFDVIPSIGITAGNVFSYANAGFLVRFGQSLSSTWGPTRVRPATSGASFFASNPAGPPFGFALFAGVEGRAVARNIFLDGNSFSTSPSVTKKVFVGDVLAGVELFTQGGSRLAFTATYRTKEYVTQPRDTFFGSVEASVKF